MEKVTYAWKNKLSSTMNYADSVSFLTSIDDRIQKYLSMFASPGQKSRFRLVPSPTLQGLFRYSGCAFHYLFQARVL